MPREWNAAAYDALPMPHLRWGEGVLDRLASHALPASMRLLDAGCGTGRDAAAARERWPGIDLVLVDGSAAMLRRAEERLGPSAEYHRADLARPLPVAPVGAVTSVAAFHWVADHRALFAHLAEVMLPGAALVAECGGRGNIAGVQQALARVSPGDDTARDAWHFATLEETTDRLDAAGFDVREVRLRPDPFRSEDPAALSAYLATVVLGAHLDRLPERQHDDFVTAVRRALPAPEVDYVRLEIDAVRR